MDHLLLVLWVEYSMMSTALGRWLDWILLQHEALVLEVVAVVVVEEVHLCLVDHLESAAVLVNLCLMERRLELLQYSLCMP